MKSMTDAVTWTDDRFDDFARNTDRRFDAVEADIRELRSEMHMMRRSMESRFDSLQRGLFQSAVTLLAALLTVGGALVATQI
jgi:hypothetical protein